MEGAFCLAVQWPKWCVLRLGSHFPHSPARPCHHSSVHFFFLSTAGTSAAATKVWPAVHELAGGSDIDLPMSAAWPRNGSSMGLVSAEGAWQARSNGAELLSTERAASATRHPPHGHTHLKAHVAVPFARTQIFHATALGFADVPRDGVGETHLQHLDGPVLAHLRGAARTVQRSMIN